MKIFLVSFTLLLTSSVLIASSPSNDKKEKVEGIYTISAISGKASDFYAIQMHPEKKDQPHLLLETHYVHPRLVVGLKLRVIGTVFKKSPKQSELAQALFFVNTPSGMTPFWQLSRHASALDLSTTPLMKLHAPSSDFSVL